MSDFHLLALEQDGLQNEVQICLSYTKSFLLRKSLLSLFIIQKSI